MKPMPERTLFTSSFAFLCALCAFAVSSPEVASARPAYRIALLKEYSVRADSPIARAECGVCHASADRKVRNLYGKEIEKALGKTNAAPAEAAAAIRKAAEKSGADGKTTFGAKLRSGELPAGR